MGDPDEATGVDWGERIGLVGGAAGLAASAFVLFGPVMRYATAGSAGTRTTGTVSGIDYLFGSPHAQVELFAWPVLLGTVAAVGLVAARRGRRRWLWAAALALAVFAVLGAMSIGFLYAPAALLLLVAAALGVGEPTGSRD